MPDTFTSKLFATLDPRTTALILIDLQRGIVSMESKPISTIEVIKKAQELRDTFHQLHALVILVHVTGSADGKDMLHPQSDAPMTRHSPLSTDWAEIVPELTPQQYDLLITKRQWGAFYGTELDLELRRRGIKTIILGGIATNIGVESTARDAYERGYHLIFAQDAMAARSNEEHVFPLTHIFPKIGNVKTTQEIIKALHREK